MGPPRATLAWLAEHELLIMQPAGVCAFVESEWPEARAQAAAEETAGLMMMRLERVGAFTLACGAGS